MGSTLAIRLKQDHENIRVIALDNLKRYGSELNVIRLKRYGVEFVHGDIRIKEDLDLTEEISCILECSAEPSVLAGYTNSPEYLLRTNLVGTLNCLELARQRGFDFIFFSTSRVYPIRTINNLRVVETDTRYEILDQQHVPGVSSEGLSENFPLEGTRSLYGATKLASEFIIQEYLEMYNLRGIINRCSILSGPWQMGKVDQGVVVLWVAHHILGGSLRYIGYGGTGKQVRDVLHIEDLYQLLKVQLDQLDGLNGQIFNVGGGKKNSVSLKELTSLCEEITGNHINIERIVNTHPSDIRVYLSDCRKVYQQTNWEPSIDLPQIILEIAAWIRDNRSLLEPILK